MAKTNKHIGSSLDGLLEETGDLVEVNAIAIKRVIAYEINQKMVNEHMTKQAMAVLMKTSRSSLDRLLDPENTSITLATLSTAAKVVGKKLSIELA
jgi:predicted XRE-type DNA-binding protein